MSADPAPSPGLRPPRVAVVLAAGKGTRMKSDRPKVLHQAAGRPLLAWVLDAARAARCDRILVVVGHGADEVRAAFPGDADLAWIEQRQQKGTGHALAQVAPAIEGEALLLVLSGDVPLVRPATLERLAAATEVRWGAMAVARLDEPGSLGRVVGDEDGTLVRIVEARDATEKELGIRTVNAGIYALPAPAIFGYLDRLEPGNAQGELYLTDAVTAAAAAGDRVALIELDDPDEALGANDRSELARIDRQLAAR